MPVTRAVDTSRMITMGCLVSIADAVMRCRSSDVPSELCEQYAGRARGWLYLDDLVSIETIQNISWFLQYNIIVLFACLGPAKGFGISPMSFARESCFLFMTSANQAVARCQALHYLYGQRCATKDTNVIFSFHAHNMSRSSPTKSKSHTSIGLHSIAAELQLIHRVCVQIGISERDPHHLARYFTGDDSRFLELYPELRDFRDIVLLFRIATAPCASMLPATARWSAQDSYLQWQFKTSKSHNDKFSGNSPTHIHRHFGTFTEPGNPAEIAVVKYEGGFNKTIRTKSEAEEEIANSISTFGEQQSVSDVGDADLDLRGGKIQVIAFEQKVSFAWAYADFYDAGSKPKFGEFDSGPDSKPWKSSYNRTNSEPRAPVVLSGGDPSTLVGQDVSTEDDILHIKKLPTFENCLDAHSSELLCQFLTVPYMRIPLILHFFAAESDGSEGTCRINALCNAQLQQVLNAAMFEPHHWKPFASDKNEAGVREFPVKPQDRRLLATPCGILFNELRHSPNVVLKCTQKMLRHILELDTGRFPSSTPKKLRMILFVIRFATRIRNYTSIIVANDDWREDGPITTSSGWNTFISGLEYITEVNIHALRNGLSILCWMLDREVISMLKQWLQQVHKANLTADACILHAHIAFVCKDTNEANLDYDTVLHILSSQIFLNCHYDLDADSLNNRISPRKVKRKPRMSRASRKPAGPMQPINTFIIPQTELLEIFQRQRGPIMRWLVRHPKDCDTIMEALLRVAASQHNRKGFCQPTQDVELQHQQASYTSRSWVNLPPPPYACLAFGRHDARRGQKIRKRIRMELEISKDDQSGDKIDNIPVEKLVLHKREESEEMSGCFVPDSEVALIAQSTRRSKKAAVKLAMNPNIQKLSPYERWLHLVVTQSVDTKINLQLGEVTIRGNRLRLLRDEHVLKNKDFLAIFGEAVDINGGGNVGWQCAVLRETAVHRWMRMIAFRHDIHVWDVPARFPQVDLSAFRRMYPSQLHHTEMWARPVCRNKIHT